MYCTKSLITTSQALTGTTQVAWREHAAKSGTEGTREKGSGAFKWLSHLMKPHHCWPAISTEKLEQTKVARENPPLARSKIKQSQPFPLQHTVQEAQSSEASFVNQAIVAFPCWSRHRRLHTLLPHPCHSCGPATAVSILSCIAVPLLAHRTSASGVSPSQHWVFMG